MLPKLLRKTLTFTAAFLDFSFLFQLLFVPMAFLASARPAIAETVPYLDISYDSGNSTFTFVAQPIKSLEYNVTYKPVDHDVEYNFGGTKSANAQGRVEFTQAAESQSGSDVITYEVESGHITVISTLRNNTQQTFSSSFVIENGEIEFFSAPQQPTGYWPQVAVDTSYISPENELVSVTFTSLPAQTGDLRVEEISLTEEQMAELGTSNNTAYEITSSMENGSFTYDLTLPNPTGSEDIQVQYSEDGETFEIADPDELTVEQKDDASVVTLRGLDHFTVFVVTSFEEVQTTSVNVGYNTSWFSSGGATITQVPSGTNGISSSEGDHHAEITGYTFSLWDGYKSVFPTGGYDTRIDVYLDMNLADGASDKRFDFSSAISNTAGGHRRDFIFHLGTNPTVAGQWYVSASNNSPGWPGNPSRSPITLTESGWYTLEHQFRDNGSGILEVTLNIYQKGNDAPLGSWVLSDTSDVINVEVGGNRYGWFIPIPTSGDLFSFPWLAIDNAVIEYDSLPINENLITVRESELQGWTPMTTGAGAVNFVPDASAPIGDGVLNLTTESDNQDRASIVKTLDVPLEDVTSLGYMTKRSSGFQVEGSAAYRLQIDADGNTSTTSDQATLVFEPYWQDDLGNATPVVNDVWQVWDVSSGKFWASIPGGNSVPGLTNGSGGPPLYTLEEVLALHPSAKVLTLSIGIGSYNLNYDILVDRVVFATKDDSSIEKYVYNFEPTPPDTTMPEMALISPTNGSIISGTYRFVVEASDESGITKILFNLNGTQYGSQLVKGDGDTWYVDIDTTTIPDGLHHVVLRVTDGAGNTKYWNNRKDIHSFTIDNTGPVAPEIVFPNPEQNFTTTPILNDWTDVTDPSGISHYRIEYQYDDGHTFANAPYREVTVSQRDHYPTLPEQGGVKIRVQAFDNQGNEGVWSDWRHYYYDATAPATPTITGFINPDLVCGALTTQSSITVDWTDVVDNESGLLTYEYFIDYPLPGGGRGEWITSLLASQRSGELNEGVHHIKVRAKDKAGNVSPWSNICDITLDTTAPAAPTNGQPHNTTLQTNNFWFTWDEVTDSTPVTYEFQSSMNPTQSGGVLTTSLWKSGVLPGPTIHSVGAPDGTWYWQVRAIDAAGNVGPWSEIWNVTLDTQAPDVQITSPGAGETLLDTGIVEVTGTITDNLKLLRYYFTIRDSEGALATGTAPLLVNTSATSASLSYFWDTSLVEEGEYTLMLEARDAADNKDAGSVHAIKVMIERTPVASPSPTPSPTPSPSPSPEPTPEPSPSPEVSPSPEPTPTPEATPSPSPEPSPEPGEVLGTSTSSRGGSSSRSVKAPVCSEATPGAISNLLITTTASGATLSWTKPEGEISHYGLEFVRLDANGNETGRYGVAALGDSNTTSFTIDNLPGGSAYRFELFAVYKCAPGPRAIATSALITAPGAPDFESGEVIITPNTGEAEVLGTSTDEEIIEEAAKHAQNDSNGSSFLGQVLGASTENCQPTSWWWIFLPGLLAGLALIHVLLSGRLRALVAALLLLGTGFGLYETNCAPWLWIGLATVMSLGSILWSLLNAPRRTTKVPFSNLSRATKMKRS